jgi:hypothetical protein
VYALRGDRDWRRSPQLTGSRQVSQLAVQAYKQLELGETTVSKLTHALGREVTEGAVLRAITELWQQLRIIPVVAAPGQAAEWQLLRTRFQKAIAEGASTSQVTAISVLASIYLQAVIAASMEEVELFLAPLTARSKVREVLRGLVATRQVHTLSMGHAPHYYVAGTLPEFAEPANTVYTSSSMPASAYFTHSREQEDIPEPVAFEPAADTAAASLVARKSGESHAPRTAAARKPGGQGKPGTARPHFSRPATLSRDRKPAQASSSSRPARRTGTDARTASPHAGSRPSTGTRWTANAASCTNGASNGNGAHATNGAGTGSHSNGNGASRTGRPANGTAGARGQKSAPAPWAQRNGHANGAKSADKPATSRNGNGLPRSASAPRADSRPEARPARGVSRKPTLTAGTKAGNSKQFGFTARPKQGTKKRG